MIGEIDIKLTSANPNFPLEPVFAFVGSSQSFRVVGVPATIGQWEITGVTVSVSYPDRTTVSQQATRTGCAWVATVPGCQTSGSVDDGFVVTASGVDEAGNAVSNYVLGVGDLFVKDLDGTIQPGDEAARMWFFQEVPTSPREGDAAFIGGNFCVYDGTAWNPSAEIDPTLTTSGAAADAKAVGDALRSGFTEWELSGVPEDAEVFRGPEFVCSEFSCSWELEIILEDGSHSILNSEQWDDPSHEDDTDITMSDGVVTVTATRHLITPTRTSQLTNDGDGSAPNVGYVLANDTRLTNARTPTGHHDTHAANGSDPLAPADIGAASASDLPYRLVEPGKWAFSGSDLESGHAYDIEISENDGEYEYVLKDNGTYSNYAIFATDSELVVDFNNYGQPQADIIATRASLPGHLLDRAGNRVEVTGDTTLTLPAANPGCLRDFLVRLEIADGVTPNISFADPTGETITYETDGDEFPVPDEAGDWVYSFTENCVAHKFAVSLKKVNEVAQGGS